MAREQIKDFYGKILGSLETQPNGDVIARDFYGKILGRWDKKMDVTKDFFGKIISRGNVVSGLVWEAASKR